MDLEMIPTEELEEAIRVAEEISDELWQDYIDHIEEMSE